MEAQAQTVEVIGAASQAANAYIDQAGILAGSFAIIIVGCTFLIYWLVKFLLRQKDEMSALQVAHAKEVADLEKKCVQEIQQAKIDAAAVFQKQQDVLWERHNQMYASINILFQKYDATAEKVVGSLQKLTVVFAHKGLIADGS